MPVALPACRLSIRSRAARHCMPPTMRSNSARSAASCFCPAAVSVSYRARRLFSDVPHSALAQPLTSRPLQRRVERALADLQDVLRREPQVLDDAVAVLRPAEQGLEDQQLQRAGKEVGRRVGESHQRMMGTRWRTG